MTMFRVLLVAAAVFSFTAAPVTFCEASSHEGKEAEAKKQTYSAKESFERFSKKLNLTAEQKEKIRPILNDEVKRIKELYAETKEKEKGIIEEAHKKVKEVLNPEQQTKYDKLIEKKMEKVKKMKKHHKEEAKEEGMEKK